MQRNSKGQFIKGSKHSKEWIEKMSMRMKGNKYWDNEICKSNQFKNGHESSLKPYSLARNKTIYNKWRTDVLTRDNYRCRDCGNENKKSLVVHHIKNWKDYPELRFVMKNGITLCRKCHLLIHKK